MNKLLNKQTGDTIIEVLIAIVMISGVLGATFAIANRSQKTTQANHERYQAQLLANQQAEWLKARSNTARASLTALDLAKKYCAKNTKDIVEITTANPDICKFNDLYYITITPKQNDKYISGSPPGVETNTFFIKVEWDSLTGGTDKVELVYGI